MDTSATITFDDRTSEGAVHSLVEALVSIQRDRASQGQRPLTPAEIAAKVNHGDQLMLNYHAIDETPAGLFNPGIRLVVQLDRRSLRQGAVVIVLPAVSADGALDEPTYQSWGLAGADMVIGMARIFHRNLLA